MKVLSTLKGDYGVLIITDLGIVIQRNSLKHQVAFEMNELGKTLVEPDVMIPYAELENVIIKPQKFLESSIQVLPKKDTQKVRDMLFFDEQRYTVAFPNIKESTLQETFELIYQTWQTKKDHALTQEEIKELSSLVKVRDSRYFSIKWNLLKIFLMLFIMVIMGIVAFVALGGIKI